MGILFAYWGIGIVVAIITTTGLRVYHKKRGEDYGFEDTVWGIVHGCMWLLTLVGGVVYMVSGFLCWIINPKKGN